MVRLVFVVIMLIISGTIYLVKAGVGKVTGKEVNFQDESKKVMQTTAKGLNWMNEQWEKAKTGNNSTNLTLGSFSEKSATEIIANIKYNSSIYDTSTSETLYIEYAVTKMNKRQFDDAIKLVMQLQEGDARNFMLKEIEQKRNV
jgi:hypothetical protein